MGGRTEQAEVAGKNVRALRCRRARRRARGHRRRRGRAGQGRGLRGCRSRPCRDYFSVRVPIPIPEVGNGYYRGVYPVEFRGQQTCPSRVTVGDQSIEVIDSVDNASQNFVLREPSLWWVPTRSRHDPRRRFHRRPGGGRRERWMDGPRDLRERDPRRGGTGGRSMSSLPAHLPASSTVRGRQPVDLESASGLGVEVEVPEGVSLCTCVPSSRAATAPACHSPASPPRPSHRARTVTTATHPGFGPGASLISGCGRRGRVDRRPRDLRPAVSVADAGDRERTSGAGRGSYRGPMTCGYTQGRPKACRELDPRFELGLTEPESAAITPIPNCETGILTRPRARSTEPASGPRLGEVRRSGDDPHGYQNPARRSSMAVAARYASRNPPRGPSAGLARVDLVFADAGGVQRHRTWDGVGVGPYLAMVGARPAGSSLVGVLAGCSILRAATSRCSRCRPTTPTGCWSRRTAPTRPRPRGGPRNRGDRRARRVLEPGQGRRDRGGTVHAVVAVLGRRPSPAAGSQVRRSPPKYPETRPPAGGRPEHSEDRHDDVPGRPMRMPRCRVVGRCLAVALGGLAIGDRRLRPVA